MIRSTALCLTLIATPALAHYGMIIPSDPMVTQEDGRSVDLSVAFAHPFELRGMTLETPVAFSVTKDGETTDLLETLSPTG